VGGGEYENGSAKPLEVQQNLIVRICLNKKETQGSSTQNYFELMYFQSDICTNNLPY